LSRSPFCSCGGDIWRDKATAADHAFATTATTSLCASTSTQTPREPSVVVLLVASCDTAAMTGVTGVLIKLGVSLVVFTAVFFVAARRNEKIKIENKWAMPLIGVVFAVLNVAVYWALAPILNLATLGAIGFLMPLVVNLIFLGATVRLFESKKWLVIDGMIAFVKLALYLTVAHGLMWLSLDYLPNR
jgi:hypothetical protein